MRFIDKNGKEIRLGTHLNVPLDTFSTGVVINNKKGELSLELRFEGKTIPLNDLSYLEILIDEKSY